MDVRGHDFPMSCLPSVISSPSWAFPDCARNAAFIASGESGGFCLSPALLPPITDAFRRKRRLSGLCSTGQQASGGFVAGRDSGRGIRASAVGRWPEGCRHQARAFWRPAILPLDPAALDPVRLQRSAARILHAVLRASLARHGCPAAGRREPSSLGLRQATSVSRARFVVDGPRTVGARQVVQRCDRARRALTRGVTAKSVPTEFPAVSSACRKPAPGDRRHVQLKAVTLSLERTGAVPSSRRSAEPQALHRESRSVLDSVSVRLKVLRGPAVAVWSGSSRSSAGSCPSTA